MAGQAVPERVVSPLPWPVPEARVKYGRRRPASPGDMRLPPSAKFRGEHREALALSGTM